jgi:hypothetical protein
MRAAEGSVISAVNAGVEASHKSLLEAQILLDQDNRDAAGQHLSVKIIAKKEGRGITFVTDTSMVLFNLLSCTCLAAPMIPLAGGEHHPVPK